MLKLPNHSVNNLTIHLIFVVKYRKKLLIKYGEEIKELLLERAAKSTKFEITTLEVDKDHVHMTINMSPTESVANIVKQLKSFTTFHIWQRHENDLTLQFWKKKMFWSLSYFACSVGDASRETIQRYIQTQGTRPQNRRTQFSHN
jgi:putative transposase